jgi:transcriptional regulator
VQSQSAFEERRMYNPPHFREERIEVLHATMQAVGAATLVSHGPDGFQATHVPILVSPQPAPWGTLHCHFARANGHLQALAGGAEVLAIVQGPQGYVSPAWYPSKAATGKVVPTWNYVAVHAHGTATLHDDPAWLRAHVAALTAHHERGSAQPWSIEDAPPDFIEGMLRAIVGVELRLSGIEGKWKVSQNRPAPDREGVAAALRARGDPASLRMAELVEEALSRRGP